MTDFGEPDTPSEAVEEEIFELIDEQSRLLGARLVRKGERVLLRPLEE